MSCSDCKHWKKWKEEAHSFGPKTLSVGDCFDSPFAKAFGKSVTPHNGVACKYFERKGGE